MKPGAEISAFCVVAPGLESLAQRELEYWLEGAPAIHSVQRTKGGIDLCGPVEQVLALNHVLKLPTRILWRVKEFRVRDFVKLYKRMKAIEWPVSLEGAAPVWRINSRKSRVKIKSKVEKTCQAAFIDSVQSGQRKAPRSVEEEASFSQEIHVRIFEDLCTVSLDTSGEFLYKRGFKKKVGKAPIRETLAAAMVWQMIQSCGGRLNELAQVSLVDPMCGSGTLLFEAERLLRPLPRGFCYEKWGAFQPQGEKNFWSDQRVVEDSLWAALYGLDMDDDIIRVASQNAVESGSRITWQVGDFFKQPIQGVRGRVWCVLNPPYNQRIRVPIQKRLFYETIVRRIHDVCRAEKIGLLVPQGVWREKDVRCQNI